MYITVGIPKSPLKPLTYSVPSDFSQISPGMRVLVPVGARFKTAFVSEVDVKPEPGIEIKPIADLLDQDNLFSAQMIELTQWMAGYYMAKWPDLLQAALPPGMDVRPETIVNITPAGDSGAALHPILQTLGVKKNLPLKEIYQLFGHKGTISELRKLEDAGYVTMVAERKRKRRTSNKVVTTDTDSWPQSEQIEKLNAPQRNALERIAQNEEFEVFLLHGVTGSGKTEVYLRAAERVLKRGGTVLMLVPEIALLPLFIHRIQKGLHEPLSVLHSELTERERLEEWRKAKRGDVKIVIGTRSAVFAPLQNLGLIVIDEEHDSSFKQQTYPRYHARETAIMRATFEPCPVILGSATPSIESFYNAGNGKYTYLTLPERVQKRQMPEIKLIDMKQEYRETGDPFFSRFLVDQISRRLEKEEQILVLQNRRGYASLLMCRDCGKVLECPHCSVTLTYHKAARRMRCHYCDYARLAPSKCEKCDSPFIHFFGAGTEKIVERLKHLFPSARIERFDRDATRGRGSIQKILTRFAMRQIDVLGGTQMLAKGHDFPNVTLVGVVGADSAIGIPDFRSSERLFQLITQVAGRSGRGAEPGEVVLQTFHPDHYAIRSSIQHNYQNFYEKEIRFRRLMQYPPFVSLANIIFAGKEASAVLQDARQFGKLVLAFRTESMKMLGPAVAPIARLSGLYRFQILVKSLNRKDLHECLRQAEERYEMEKHKSQFSIDIDPYVIV